MKLCVRVLGVFYALNPDFEYKNCRFEYFSTLFHSISEEQKRTGSTGLRSARVWPLGSSSHAQRGGPCTYIYIYIYIYANIRNIDIFQVKWNIVFF